MAKGPNGETCVSEKHMPLEQDEKPLSKRENVNQSCICIIKLPRDCRSNQIPYLNRSLDVTTLRILSICLDATKDGRACCSISQDDIEAWKWYNKLKVFFPHFLAVLLHSSLTQADPEVECISSPKEGETTYSLKTFWVFLEMAITVQHRHVKKSRLKMRYISDHEESWGFTIGVSYYEKCETSRENR